MPNTPTARGPTGSLHASPLLGSGMLRHVETFRLIEQSLCKVFQKSSHITLEHQWLRFARSPAFKCSESAGSLRCRMLVAASAWKLAGGGQGLGLGLGC